MTKLKSEAGTKRSPSHLENKSGAHKIQGIGAKFYSKTYLEIIDKTITVSSGDAINITKRLGEEEGLLVGISSGANVMAAYRWPKHSRQNCNCFA